MSGKANKISYKLDEHNLSRMKELERSIYDGTGYTGMQHYTSWQGISHYCQCAENEVRLMMGEDWYVLIAEHDRYIEIVDLASLNKKMNLFVVMDYLKTFEKPMFFDAREKTSYRLVQALSRCKKIDIARDMTYSWNGEPFHEIVMIPTGMGISIDRQELRRMFPDDDEDEDVSDDANVASSGGMGSGF